MSGDREQDYFSDGITEEIITGLSRLRWFFVIARNSTFAYKGQVADVRQVGRELGVRYVLEGSVRRSGQRMRVTAQLVDAEAGHHIWAERYDRDLVDMFAMQDEITAMVVAAIEPKLLAAEGVRSETRSVDHLDAWDLVARAMTRFWRLSAADSESAIAILDEAARHHSSYSPPHSLLAFALLVAAHMGWRRSPDDRGTSERLALRALEIDASDPWAYMALGYLAFSARRTDESVSRFSAAIDLNPNFAAAYGYCGWAQAHDARSDEAIRNLNQAIRLSPRDPFNVFYSAGFAAAHYVAGRYAEAAEWARQALMMRPGHLGARRKLCASLAQAGRIEEAHREMAELRKLQPDLSIAWIKQAVPYTDRPMRHFLDGMRKAGVKD
jgi:adenylate cyclase